MRFLLDTNVLSELARQKPAARVAAWIRAQSTLDLAISALTLGEIEKGVKLLPAGRRREALEAWLSSDLPRQFSGRVLAVDTLAWGRLSAAGRQAGRELPVVDGLLLATASVHALTLVTRNEGDCRDRGISVLNPWTEA
ncbi:MAG: PIN domain-containing protein [Gemmatimonas sp.]|nr:PIN domain-containing protein [Gemmatimonas sp.]